VPLLPAKPAIDLDVVIEKHSHLLTGTERLVSRHLMLSPSLKLLKRLLHDGKGDANLQGFAVTDPLDFQIPEHLG